jgi:hypothetical protein
LGKGRRPNWADRRLDSRGVDRHDDPGPDAARERRLRLAGKAAYWVAVLIVSLALVFLLILLLESRDNSSVNGQAPWPASALARV